MNDDDGIAIDGGDGKYERISTVPGKEVITVETHVSTELHQSFSSPIPITLVSLNGNIAFAGVRTDKDHSHVFPSGGSRCCCEIAVT